MAREEWDCILHFKKLDESYWSTIYQIMLWKLYAEELLKVSLENTRLKEENTLLKQLLTENDCKFQETLDLHRFEITEMKLRHQSRIECMVEDKDRRNLDIQERVEKMFKEANRLYDVLTQKVAYEVQLIENNRNGNERDQKQNGPFEKSGEKQKCPAEKSQRRYL